jgi:hypothetical protein
MSPENEMEGDWLLLSISPKQVEPAGHCAKTRLLAIRKKTQTKPEIIVPKVRLLIVVPPKVELGG